jgi:metallophosphoesterase (TIGR00282 family)
MNILFVGDIVGRPGRRALAAALPTLVEQHAIDFTMANGENAAGGMGITPGVAQELLSMGVDVITLGNHVWKNRSAVQAVDDESRLIRPANFPPGVPGQGEGVFRARSGARVGVLNLCGRTFMEALDCPFRAADEAVARLSAQTPVCVVDMHAEATSEKQAMGWFLDGRVSGVLGTHTHVQTADERVLPKGTAYVTDVGMTGPKNSILGMEAKGILGRFLTRMPVKFEVAGGPVLLSAVAIEVEEETGRARGIRRIQQEIPEAEEASEPSGE